MVVVDSCDVEDEEDGRGGGCRGVANKSDNGGGGGQQGVSMWSVRGTTVMPGMGVDGGGRHGWWGGKEMTEHILGPSGGVGY